MREKSFDTGRLIVKKLQGSITDAESRQLEEWLAVSEENRRLFGQLSDPAELPRQLEKYYRYDEEAALERLRQLIPAIRPKKAKTFRIMRRAAAAAILVLVAGSLWWFSRPKPEPLAVQPHENRFRNDVMPGQYKAKLTLANGSTIVLDSAAQGSLAREGNTVIVNRDGRLEYEAGAKKQNGALYNTLSTAPGQTYRTVLADGSRIWLNAASSVTFPVNFSGGERKVELTGEAYFEVAHNAAKPFVVQFHTAPGQGGHVTVLGTHFNINTYQDEPDVKITLLEGAVKVAGNNKSVLLQPGEQASMFAGAGTGGISVGTVDTDAATAWVKGMFRFQGSDIEPLMRQLARWYDVDVTYKGKVTKKFSGKIPRSMTAVNVFRALEETGGVHFSIDGRKVVISP